MAMCMREGVGRKRRDKMKKGVLFAGLLFKRSQCLKTPKSKAKNSFQVSHMGGIDATT